MERIYPCEVIQCFLIIIHFLQISLNATIGECMFRTSRPKRSCSCWFCPSEKVIYNK